MLRLCIRCAAMALVLIAGWHARPAGAQDVLTLESCEIRGVPDDVSCGTYEVFEDRVAMRGRRIGIAVIVLHATSEDTAPDPLVYVPGGPGSSATESAAYMAQAYVGIRAHRDIVLVDQRGTGGSHPLNCRLFGPPEDLQSYFGRFFPLEDVEACRAELEATADLTLYTTPIAMDDLDDVRAALGYDQINLMGGSYGTRAVLVYLRRHGKHARSAVLLGVTTTNAFLPRDFAPDAQRALDGVVAECLGGQRCASAFPDLRDEIAAVFARLADGPVAVEVVNPETGDVEEVQLSRNLVGEAVRYLLYGSVDAGKVPLLLHHAANDDFTPLAEFALTARRYIVAGGSNGMYLSVTCAEDLPWIAPGEAERLAEGTFLGDYRVRDQRAACALWPRGEIPDGYSDPVRSSVPTLLVSGQWDPVTPPQYAQAVAGHLEHSLLVVVPHGGHGLAGLEGKACIDRLVQETIERGSVEGLDTGCVQEIRRPPFPTSLPPMRPITLPDEELERFAGRYTAQEGAFVLVVEAADGKLHLDATGQPPLFAVPVGSDRFRVAGVAGAYVIFGVEDGRVTTAAVEQGGTIVLRLRR